MLTLLSHYKMNNEPPPIKWVGEGVYCLINSVNLFALALADIVWANTDKLNDSYHMDSTHTRFHLLQSKNLHEAAA